MYMTFIRVTRIGTIRKFILVVALGSNPLTARLLTWIKTAESREAILGQRKACGLIDRANEGGPNGGKPSDPRIVMASRAKITDL